MKEEIRNLVNYVIEAMKDYRQDQSAETYRLSRINQETNPASDAPATTAKKFAKINADYKEEKRLERAPRGPQTRKKPMEEGYAELKDITKKFGNEVVQTGRDVKDALVGGKRVPKGAEPKPASPKTPPTSSGPTKRPKAKPDLNWRDFVSKDQPKIEEGAQVPAGAKTGPARKPTDLKAQQTKDPTGSIKPFNKPVGDPFSKADWRSRKAAMDKASDG